ncbi:hypothetical protein PGT21_020368 [Puccinia graminis f. sp. tritici]|uniref:Uncharacterized protein n=1 Tax=Puccinia graminis f. sp. tritici TaxID=56615 RepID=A0A5B0Q4H2_PUCGR|nr:hypothetical protein PGT21_020368 [Puccinia graminis f. sp. tritici]KAA1107834.1 hypothetical protein PGTUg99_025645 [Puccinia graminis f. sp. tritici]KAA1115677.1 hypothetical protein PGTUg99_024658 [Puccinia graminis f. sp. tritici]
MQFDESINFTFDLSCSPPPAGSLSNTVQRILHQLHPEALTANPDSPPSHFPVPSCCLRLSYAYHQHHHHQCRVANPNQHRQSFCLLIASKTRYIAHNPAESS